MKEFAFPKGKMEAHLTAMWELDVTDTKDERYQVWPCWDTSLVTFLGLLKARLSFSSQSALQYTRLIVQPPTLNVRCGLRDCKLPAGDTERGQPGF